MAISPIGRVVISNPQSYVKDVYASAPAIDLTVRVNGEEKVMVMDSLGNFNIAGIAAPTVAPTVSTAGVTSGSGFPNTVANYWAYQFVYVAKKAYPLVENAVTGGGSPAPRSNPSPNSAIQNTIAANAASAHDRVLSITCSPRGDISNIWIYRTGYFTTSQEAQDNADAGNLDWIGEIQNTQDSATITFTDNNSVVFGANEQIENDNFLAPIFDKVIFVDPYFWGFGNSVLSINVSVTSSGLITATSQKWFSGRDGQTITFARITTGGFDGHGTYYFKTITNTTAQVYSDLQLTQPAGINFSGTTVTYIKGQSTTLYRSKIRNPFSWGETLLIGDLQVPQLYTFSIGGGIGTAINVIPNQNLLKLDTEGPNYCYTLNLKNAGTPDFESSLRVIADNYSVSNQHTQFSATLENGQNVLWGIDTKSFSIVQCDGTEQRPVSSLVYKTLRAITSVASDRLFFHGFYCPRLELNCVLIKTLDATASNFSKLLYQHAPTGFWGEIDMTDLVCSSQVFDSSAGQQKVIVGTNAGFVGEIFAEDIYQNWFTTQLDYNGQFQKGFGDTVPDDTANQISVDFSAPNFSFVNSIGGEMKGLIGNWITILVPTYIIGTVIGVKRYYCQINGVTNNGQTLTFNTGGFPGVFPLDPPVYPKFYIGLIELVVGRSFNAQIPFDYKKLEEVWSTWIYTPIEFTQQGFTEPPTIEIDPTFINVSADTYLETALTSTNNTNGIIQSDILYSMQTNIPIDEAKTFGLIFRDRNYIASQLVNYELRLSKLDGNFPESSVQRYPQ